ncbi:hypothetical protein EVA_08788, partial [gut metagenome]
MDEVFATDTLVPAPKDGKPGQDGKPGADGKPGPAGPMLYPAGRFEDINQVYVRTQLTAPFVEYKNQYYVLNKEGTVSGINPLEDYTHNGLNATWLLMDKIKYAFIEALVADYGKIASAVFWREFMLSQYGVDSQGQPVETADGFKGFMPDMANFKPNILMDFLTGYAHFAKGNATFKADGTVNIKGKFESIDSSRTHKIVIDPNGEYPSLELYQKSKMTDKWDTVCSLNYRTDENGEVNPCLIMGGTSGGNVAISEFTKYYTSFLKNNKRGLFDCLIGSEEITFSIHEANELIKDLTISPLSIELVKKQKNVYGEAVPDSSVTINEDGITFNRHDGTTHTAIP